MVIFALFTLPSSFNNVGSFTISSENCFNKPSSMVCALVAFRYSKAFSLFVATLKPPPEQIDMPPGILIFSKMIACRPALADAIAVMPPAKPYPTIATSMISSKWSDIACASVNAVIDRFSLIIIVPQSRT